MLKKLLNRLIVYIFDVIEQEQKRRKFELLLRLMEEKEKRKKEIQDELDKKQRAAAKYKLDEMKRLQDTCKHLKGNTGVLLQYTKDYNVIQHTMPDGRVVVKCAICGKEWSEAAGNLKEGFDMMRYSTNTPTSSEVSYGKPKDRDKVLNEIDAKVEMAARQRPLDKWSFPGGEPFPFIGPGWPSIWKKAEARLKRLAARKKKKGN